jgi:hypothetical protein
MTNTGEDHCCFTCKKPKATPWTFEICERAGLQIDACSVRCMRVHEPKGGTGRSTEFRKPKPSG